MLILQPGYHNYKKLIMFSGQHTPTCISHDVSSDWNLENQVENQVDFAILKVIPIKGTLCLRNCCMHITSYSVPTCNVYHFFKRGITYCYLTQASKSDCQCWWSKIFKSQVQAIPVEKLTITNSVLWPLILMTIWNASLKSSIIRDDWYEIA